MHAGSTTTSSYSPHMNNSNTHGEMVRPYNTVAPPISTNGATTSTTELPGPGQMLSGLAAAATSQQHIQSQYNAHQSHLAEFKYPQVPVGGTRGYIPVMANSSSSHSYSTQQQQQQPQYYHHVNETSSYRQENVATTQPSSSYSQTSVWQPTTVTTTTEAMRSSSHSSFLSTVISHPTTSTQQQQQELQTPTFYSSSSDQGAVSISANVSNALPPQSQPQHLATTTTMTSTLSTSTMAPIPIRKATDDVMKAGSLSRKRSRETPGPSPSRHSSVAPTPPPPQTPRAESIFTMPSGGGMTVTGILSADMDREVSTDHGILESGISSSGDRIVVDDGKKQALDHHHPLIYSAIYSGVPVYEMVCKQVPVMRRRVDGYINATQILKVAGLSKPKRTAVMQRQVLTGVHEKIQGGYGRYQGTWVPLESGRALAQSFNVEKDLEPLLTFDPSHHTLLPRYLFKPSSTSPGGNNNNLGISNGTSPFGIGSADSFGPRGPWLPMVSSDSISSYTSASVVNEVMDSDEGVGFINVSSGLGVVVGRQSKLKKEQLQQQQQMQEQLQQERQQLDQNQLFGLNVSNLLEAVEMASREEEEKVALKSDSSLRMSVSSETPNADRNRAGSVVSFTLPATVQVSLNEDVGVGRSNSSKKILGCLDIEDVASTSDVGVLSDGAKSDERVVPDVGHRRSNLYDAVRGSTLNSESSESDEVVMMHDGGDPAAELINNVVTRQSEDTLRSSQESSSSLLSLSSGVGSELLSTTTLPRPPPRSPLEDIHSRYLLSLHLSDRPSHVFMSQLENAFDIPVHPSLDPPLHWAARLGRCKTVKELIVHGADVCVRSQPLGLDVADSMAGGGGGMVEGSAPGSLENRDVTALMRAFRSRGMWESKCVDEMVRLLAGSLLEKDSRGRTALHYAMMFGSNIDRDYTSRDRTKLDETRWLQFGEVVEDGCGDVGSHSVSHIRMYYVKGLLETISKLGVNEQESAQSNKGKKPATLSDVTDTKTTSSSTVESLGAGASPVKRVEPSFHPVEGGKAGKDIIRVLLESLDENGDTVAHLACRIGDPTLVQFLIEICSDVPGKGTLTSDGAATGSNNGLPVKGKPGRRSAAAIAAAAAAAAIAQEKMAELEWNVGVFTSRNRLGLLPRDVVGIALNGHRYQQQRGPVLPESSSFNRSVKAFCWAWEDSDEKGLGGDDEDVGSRMVQPAGPDDKMKRISTSQGDSLPPHETTNDTKKSKRGNAVSKFQDRRYLLQSIVSANNGESARASMAKSAHGTNGTSTSVKLDNPLRKRVDSLLTLVHRCEVSGKLDLVQELAAKAVSQFGKKTPLKKGKQPLDDKSTPIKPTYTGGEPSNTSQQKDVEAPFTPMTPIKKSHKKRKQASVIDLLASQSEQTVTALNGFQGILNASSMDIGDVSAVALAADHPDLFVHDSKGRLKKQRKVH
ncbi:hypothetical protein HDU76_004010 [Blyttiomyces sp. JEL0837]|nr:hypothetical protein HDU76_004010 [Blyttiomyces sp. JEL0837]